MNEIKPEYALYPYVLKWLKKDFKTSDAMMGRDPHAALFCADISQKKTVIGGHWSRPDLAAVAYRRGKFTPGWDATIFSFEVKCFSTIDQAAVYEAVSHTRFAHYSYLLWQDEDMPAEDRWRIVDLCREFGVGAITTAIPSDENTYRLRAKPRRNQITILESDHFIKERFSPIVQTDIKRWLSSNGWQQLGEGAQSI